MALVRKDRSGISLERRDVKDVSTWQLKGCPRCSGDLYVHYKIKTCLQCGNTIEEGFVPGPMKPHRPYRRKEEVTQ